MDEALITCPKCNNVLDRVMNSGVELDLCPSCGGIWLNRGELEKLKLDSNWFELAALKRLAQGQRRVPPTSATVRLPCPACSGKLAALPFEDIALDVCEQCKGLWLDKGELDAALRALDSKAEPDFVNVLMGTIAVRRSS